MIKFPCTKSCLKYPVCINKTSIRCDALREYYELTDGIKSIKKINNIFPNLTQLHAVGSCFYKISSKQYLGLYANL